MALYVNNYELDKHNKIIELMAHDKYVLTK